MNAWSFVFRSSLERKWPRRRSLRTRIENQSSIGLSQEACLGVQWNTIGWEASRKNASRVALDWRIPLLPLTPRSSVMLLQAATQRTTDAETWVFRLSATRCHFGQVGSVATRAFRNGA